MEDKLSYLEEREADNGLVINTRKTKVLKVNTNRCTCLKVKGRKGKARTSFRMNTTIWRAGNITLNTKIRLTPKSKPSYYLTAIIGKQQNIS